MSRIVAMMKAARAYPWLNVPLTTALRAGTRAVGYDSRWLRTHLPRSGVARVTLPNGADLRLWSRGDDWISTQVFWGGLPGFEPELVPVFAALAPRASAIVDVGAYVGYFSVMAGLLNPGAKVVALEPYPPTFARLVRNVQLNGLTNVDAHNVAAGAEAGLALLHHRPEGYSPAASLNPDHVSPEGGGVATTMVSVVPLDSLLEQLRVERVDLIKIDTETTEPEVLAGAAQTLRRDRPDILCEVLHGYRPGICEDITGLLSPLGYRFFELRVGGCVEHASVVQSPLHNYLFSTRTLDELQLVDDFER